MEWAVAALGLALLAAAIMVIVAGELRSTSQPPAIRVITGGIHEAGDRWLVRFEAHNDGDAPVAAIVVRAVLVVGDSTESVDAELDYLPAQSGRGGAVYFDEDPRRGRLTFVPVSHRHP